MIKTCNKIHIYASTTSPVHTYNWLNRAEVGWQGRTRINSGWPSRSRKGVESTLLNHDLKMYAWQIWGKSHLILLIRLRLSSNNPMSGLVNPSASMLLTLLTEHSIGSLNQPTTPSNDFLWTRSTKKYIPKKYLLTTKKWTIYVCSLTSL